MRRLSLVALPNLPLIAPGDDLAALIASAATAAGEAIQDGDVVVVAQKIVSKAEGRIVDLGAVEPSAAALELAARTGKDARLVELILNESEAVVRAKPGVVIVAHRRGWVHANAGIDQSNVQGGDRALLLPADPDRSAAELRVALARHTGAALAVIISDSFGRAWRLGTVGTAIGASGIACLKDLRGQPDLFGRRLQATEIGHADEIAAAASILMGQADEACPVVIVRGVSGVPADGRAADLIRPPREDLFR